MLGVSQQRRLVRIKAASIHQSLPPFSYSRSWPEYSLEMLKARDRTMLLLSMGGTTHRDQLRWMTASSSLGFLVTLWFDVNRHLGSLQPRDRGIWDIFYTTTISNFPRHLPPHRLHLSIYSVFIRRGQYMRCHLYVSLLNPVILGLLLAFRLRLGLRLYQKFSGNILWKSQGI